MNASDFAHARKLYASIEVDGHRGWVVRYSKRQNCRTDDVCQIARISSRRLAAGEMALLPSGKSTWLSPTRIAWFEAGAFPALTFEHQNVRFSIAIAASTEHQLLAEARRIFRVRAATPSAPRGPATERTQTSPAPPDPIPTLEFYPHAAAAGGILTVRAARPLNNVKCVLLGDRPARFTPLADGRLRVVVPSLPQSGLLELAIDDGVIGAGGAFTALPDVTQPRLAGVGAPHFDDTYGVVLPHADRTSAYLKRSIALLRAGTSAPIVLPRYVPQAVTADLDEITPTSYRISFRNRRHERVADFSLAQRWRDPGSAYDPLDPTFGAHRQLSSGISSAYAPYVCEATCGDAQLAWLYDGTLIVQHLRMGSWLELRDMADSFESVR